MASTALQQAQATVTVQQATQLIEACLDLNRMLFYRWLYITHKLHD